LAKNNKNFAMTQHEFDRILHRYVHDKCTDQEKIWVEEWFENMQREEIFISDDLNEQAKENVRAALEKRFSIKSEVPYNYRKFVKIAAAVVFMAAGIFVYFEYSKTAGPIADKFVHGSSDNEMIRFTNTEKTPVEVKLKDGSTILVHPGSEINYPEKFGKTREVYLSGEAFFDIAKDPDHPFVVRASEITTRVLGTSFLIKAYKEQKEIMVAVSTGRVSVFSKPGEHSSEPGNEEVILTPNQRIVYNRDEGTTEKTLVDSPQLLVPNPSLELKYINEPVSKLFKALETMYGVTIQYDEKVLSNCSITTEMTDEGLFERIDLICHVLRAKYTVKNTTIIIEANGCSN
jgi:transmembrane sensor